MATIRGFRGKPGMTVLLTVTTILNQSILKWDQLKFMHYGFLASIVKAKKLGLCRELLNLPPQIVKVVVSTIELIEMLTGVDVTLCPVCGLLLNRDPPHQATA